MDDFNAVEKYLLRGEYPDNFTKAEKANLRRRCRNNFQLADGVLKYRTAIYEARQGGRRVESLYSDSGGESKNFGKLPWRIGWYGYG